MKKHAWKYQIIIDFTIAGKVEESDISGAIYSFSEGLILDLNLRELQKTNRIDRIECILQNNDTITNGELCIPSNLDLKDNAMLAACIETVKMVRNYPSSFTYREVRDLREEDKATVFERAAEIYNSMELKQAERRNMDPNASILTNSKNIVEWGPDKLPAGIDMEESSALIIVEGRADIHNCARAGIKNTIAVEGVGISDSLIELSRKKDIVIAYLDGDTGGQTIYEQLLEKGVKLDYIAWAPEGMEVEDLTINTLLSILKTPKKIKRKKEGD